MRKFQYCTPELDPDTWMNISANSFMDAAERAAEYDDYQSAEYLFANGSMTRMDIRDVDTGEVKRYTISVEVNPQYHASELS